MDERKDQENCSFCGDQLESSEWQAQVCEDCKDTWEREIDSHW